MKSEAINFLKIVFTPPKPFYDEPEVLTRLIESGSVDIIHLRHPETSEETIRRIIDAIPERLHGKLRIHDHFGLTSEFKLGGVHLNTRNALPPAGKISVSSSCHSVEEARDFIKKYPDCAYVTLSPVFDSISKEGYMSAKFDPEEVASLSATGKVVALGGVEPRHFKELARRGFVGGAMLGYVWSNPEGKKLSEIVEEINGVSF